MYGVSHLTDVPFIVTVNTAIAKFKCKNSASFPNGTCKQLQEYPQSVWDQSALVNARRSPTVGRGPVRIVRKTRSYHFLHETVWWTAARKYSLINFWQASNFRRNAITGESFIATRNKNNKMVAKLQRLFWYASHRFIFHHGVARNCGYRKRKKSKK
jgi:hypothetical protein